MGDPKMKKILILIAFAIMFVGCSGNQNLSIPTEKIVTDKKSAYVVFMRPDTFAGAAYSPTISEFFPETKKAIEIADLGIGEKVIYKVNPGKHYFHIDFQFDTVHSLDAREGEVYYFDTHKHMLISAINRQETEILSKHIEGKECSQELLDRYLLEEIITYEDKSNNMMLQKDSKPTTIKYTNWKFWLEVHCKNNKVVYANYLYGMKTDDLNSETELVQLSNKKLEEGFKLSNIIEDFNVYVNKFEGIPYKDGISLSILQEFDNKYYKSFKSDELEITFDETKTTEGSQLARYFSLTLAQMHNNATTTKIRCTIKSKKTGEIVAILNGSSVTGGGILGGFDTGKKDLIDTFNSYITRNLYI
jgi:hypothetical protein